MAFLIAVPASYLAQVFLRPTLCSVGIYGVDPCGRVAARSLIRLMVASIFLVLLQPEDCVPASAEIGDWLLVAFGFCL